MVSRAREWTRCQAAVSSKRSMVLGSIPWEFENMSSVRQGWVIGGAVVIALFLFSSFYNGKGTHYRPEGSTAVSTQAE
jgi:hypothetical protein